MLPRSLPSSEIWLPAELESRRWRSKRRAHQTQLRGDLLLSRRRSVDSYLVLNSDCSFKPHTGIMKPIFRIDDAQK